MQTLAKNLTLQVRTRCPRNQIHTLATISDEFPAGCDVFINHRGIDTKRTVAGLLYYHLSRLGLRPFLDSKNMKAGDKLFDKIDMAIHNCKVGVAVFSPHYCDSYFCLHELALLMESRKRVIPIFCNVKPSELRVKDTKNCPAKELQRFNRALQEAKYTVGLTFDSSRGDWSELLRTASDAVLENLLEGVDYLKYDNCYTDGSRPRERYPKMSFALHKVGRPILFSFCEWGHQDAAKWAGLIGSTWRTTGDIEDNFDSMTSNADQNNAWATYAGPGRWNDPDMLEVGNGNMSAVEYQAHFSIWAAMKVPLLIGCEVQNMSNDTLSILANKEAIDVNQDPLGVQASKIRSEHGLEVWAGPLSGKRVVVVLWNRRHSNATIFVTRSEIGLPPSIPLVVRDLWAQSFVTTHMHHELTAHVAAHDVKMYVLTPY